MFDEDKQPDENINNDDFTESQDSSIEKDSLLPGDNEDVVESIQSESEIEQVNFSEEILSDEDSVTVQPVQFTSFDEEENIHGKENRNLDLLMNVNLQMSVELGRTELPFKKVLELTRGSIISLDKLAGEPVELYANGKLVAFGEVVVIEDNFGLRITSIAAPEERLRTVHEQEEKV